MAHDWWLLGRISNHKLSNSHQCCSEALSPVCHQRHYRSVSVQCRHEYTFIHTKRVQLEIRGLTGRSTVAKLGRKLHKIGTNLKNETKRSLL